jgi:hypothetical protein
MKLTDEQKEALNNPTLEAIMGKNGQIEAAVAEALHKGKGNADKVVEKVAEILAEKAAKEAQENAPEIPETPGNQGQNPPTA